MVYKPTDLKAFLKSINAHPKKSFSQNFLIDQNILNKIVHFSDLLPSDTVVEIGAGPGALSEKLMQKASLIAIEKDPLFANALLRFENIKVIEEDVLKVDFSQFGPCKVVANLPYNITTPILTKLIEVPSIKSITIMIQKEVAMRILAPLHSKEMSSLTLFLQYHAEIKRGFLVKNTCFYPKPKVDSFVIQLLPNQKYHVENKEALFKMIRTAYNQKRKMVKTSLKTHYPLEKLEAFFGQKRPQDVALEEWITFFTQS